MAKRAYPTKYVALDRCIDDLLADRKCREELPPGPDRLEVRELMETAQRLRTFFRASLWPEPAKGDQHATVA